MSIIVVCQAFQVWSAVREVATAVGAAVATIAVMLVRAVSTATVATIVVVATVKKYCLVDVLFDAYAHVFVLLPHGGEHF